jgi:hypothetical protein
MKMKPQDKLEQSYARTEILANVAILEEHHAMVDTAGPDDVKQLLQSYDMFREAIREYLQGEVQAEAEDNPSGILSVAN